MPLMREPAVKRHRLKAGIDIFQGPIHNVINEASK